MMQAISSAKAFSATSLAAIRCQRVRAQQMPSARMVSRTVTSGARVPPVLSQTTARVPKTVCSADAGSGEQPTLEALIVEKNNENAVMIYSKTYCPFCNRVKSLFASLNVDVTVAELDQIVEGDEIQDTLFSLTGQRTVPSVFIGGQHVGGCDGTMF
mmetsp:Transcript_26714/g.58159  ORF Transcript_26714/g.58159 Transcript_26714/m.58159 type:complete len:157 (-) Transcript_26714:685-1155(-)